MAERPRRRYRVIATSVRAEDVTEADRIVETLKDEGWPFANRSLVIREALHCLCEALQGKSPEEVFDFFLDRRAKRIPIRPKTAGRE